MHYYEFVTVCKNQQKSDHNQVYGTKGWGFELLKARQNRSKTFDFDLFFMCFLSEKQLRPKGEAVCYISPLTFTINAFIH